MTTPSATGDRRGLELLETVDLLCLDGESCLLPTTQRNVLICEPYVRLIFKSAADLRAAAPVVETTPPGITFVPTGCSRPVRVDLPLFPLLNRLARRLSAVAFDVTLDFASPVAGEDWCEWVAILRRNPDGGQSFLRKLRMPEAKAGPAGVRVVFEAGLPAADLALPDLSFAIQWPAGAPRVRIAAVHARIDDVRFGDDGAVRSAVLPPTVTLYSGVDATDGQRVSLPVARGDPLLSPEDGSGTVGNECLALVHEGGALVRARRLSREQLAPFLDDLSRLTATAPTNAGAALSRASDALARRHYLEALAELDSVDPVQPRQKVQAAGQRMAALMALRRFEEAIAIYQRAPSIFQEKAQVRYLEACASTNREAEARRVLTAALGESGPGSLDKLTLMYRYAPLLPADAWREMTARIAASAGSVDRLPVLVRVAHDLTTAGDIAAASRVLDVVAAKARAATDRSAVTLGRAQIAFAERRYSDQAAAFNEALALWDRLPVQLRDDTAPLSANNVRSDTNAAVADGPLVSVVMTCFNSEASIEYSVRSILDQTYRNFELVVVDDASSDGAMAKLSEIARADPRLRLKRLPVNSGTYFAKNTGLACARGMFATCQDADDWAHPEKIAVMVGALLESEHLVATGVQHVRASPDRGLQCRGNNYIRPDASSLMFRRGPVLDRIGYFDSVRSAADSEFARRLERSFGRRSLAYREEPLSLVHWSPATLSGGGTFAIDDDTGIATPVRDAYRAAYSAWHEQAEDLKIEFPLTARPFPVPVQMLPRKGGAAT